MIIFNRLFQSIILIGCFVSKGNSTNTETDLKERRARSVFKDSGLSKDTLSSGGSGKYLEVLEQLKDIVSEIKAEQSLRSNLEQRLRNASILVEDNARNLSLLADKVKNVENSVDSDTNFWKISETCGGVVIAQSGKLSYFQATSRIYYSNMELKKFCIWTVRVNYRSKIKVTLSATMMNATATEFFLEPNRTHSTKNTIVSPLKTYLFNGPVIILSIQLRPMLSTVSIVFEGVGMNVHQDTEFQHYYRRGNFGNFDQATYQQSVLEQSTDSNKKITFTTIVIDTERSNLAELEVNPRENCSNSAMVVQLGFELEPKQLQSCCNGTCPPQTYYTLDGWFLTSYSSFSPQKNLNVRWKSRSDPSDSVDICGGVVMGKTGKISYKRASNYFNNERCVWVIYPFPKSAVKITSVANGMESTYDHLVVTEVDGDILESTELSLNYGHVGNFKGRFILVTFYTDPSVVRQGFELTWEADGPSEHDRKLENEQIIHKPSESNRLRIKKESTTSRGFSLYFVGRMEQDGSSLHMTLSNLSSQSASTCDNTTIKMLGSHGGFIGNFYHKIKQPCNSSPVSLSSPDGIGAVLVENSGLKNDVEMDVTWEHVPPDTTDIHIGDECGGVLHAPSGRINYKLEEMYTNNERCIWIIHTPTNEGIELRLLKDGFEDCCDYILVNTINPENGTLNKETSLITRENNTRMFNGPILVVSFRSDGSVVGKGFALQYTGKGILSNHPYTYHIIHRDEPSGSYEYPQLDNVYWDSGNGLFTENEILVIAYSNPAETGEGSFAIKFNVSIEDVVLGMDENCNSDNLNFYSTPSKDGFLWSESYPKEKCKKNGRGNCADCLQTDVALNDTLPHGFGSTFKAFLAIYKPVKTESTNQTFHVHWDVASGCGGVIIEGSGRIAYKLGGRYKNSEQCIWTVYSPSASKIRFNLQSSGFETCCDYVILNSLNMEDGSLGSAEFLRSDSKLIIMDGPVVFVTFRSDGSVSGEGFSLTFTPALPSLVGTILTTEDPTTTEVFTPHDVHNFHGKRRNSSFSFPTRDDDDISIGKGFIATFTFSPESFKNESFLRYGTKIAINSVHLGFDNETCTSDTLTFFEAPTRFGYNTTKSYALNLNETPFCHEAGLNQMDDDQSNPNIISSTFPAFIAIFKSNSNPSLDGGTSSRVKGMRIEWTDIIRLPSASR